jgi:hypothetical protein
MLLVGTEERYHHISGMAKPWSELHDQVDNDEAFSSAIAFKGMTVVEIHAGTICCLVAFVPMHMHCTLSFSKTGSWMEIFCMQWEMISLRIKK